MSEEKKQDKEERPKPPKRDGVIPDPVPEPPQPKDGGGVIPDPSDPPPAGGSEG